MKKFSVSPAFAKCEQASLRLSSVINCTSILQYAGSLRNPAELEFLSNMLMRMSLCNPCRKSDVSQCINYLDDLTDNLLRPKYVEEHNHGCQQFYGKIRNSQFSTPQYSPHNRKVA